MSVPEQLDGWTVELVASLDVDGRFQQTDQRFDLGGGEGVGEQRRRPKDDRLAVFLAVLVYIRHASNIARLREGIEPKIGKKKG